MRPLRYSTYSTVIFTIVICMIMLEFVLVRRETCICKIAISQDKVHLSREKVQLSSGDTIHVGAHSSNENNTCTCPCYYMESCMQF